MFTGAPDPPQVRIDSQRPTWIVLEITMPPYMGIPPADRIVTRYEDLTSLEEIKEFDEGKYLVVDLECLLLHTSCY